MTIIERTKQPIDKNLRITPGTTPIPYFGRYDSAVACTISLNPSDREFCDQNGKILSPDRERLCSRLKLGRADDQPLSDEESKLVVLQSNYYFHNRPYRSWFNKYERFLQYFELSYYSGTVVHLDLVQWATTPFWGELEEEVKEELLRRDLPFLKQLLQKDFNYIFLNGKTTVNEVSKHLGLHLREEVVSILDKATTKVYLGEYGNTAIIGWSTYLQSASVGSYANVDKMATAILAASKKHT